MRSVDSRGTGSQTQLGIAPETLLWICHKLLEFSDRGGSEGFAIPLSVFLIYDTMQ
jgi:hypothetical protein